MAFQRLPVETFLTLRIYPKDLEPEQVTRILQIEPTSSVRRGELHKPGSQHRWKHHGWFYTTEKLCDSTDTRDHIEIILRLLEGKIEQIRELRKSCEIDIFSYWISDGQGGPELIPDQMLKLGELGISIGWDMYLDHPE